MKYKMIELGNDVKGIAVTDNGLPIMVDDEGKETGIDAIHLLSKVPSLQEEAKNHRLKANDVQKEYDEFKEKYAKIADPVKALEALTKIQDIDGQKLIDAEDAATLRKQLQAAHDKELEAVKVSAHASTEKLQAIIDSQQADIFDALVLQNFNTSQWFAGESPKTYFFPEAAKSVFGKHFKVEKDSGTGKNRVIGYHIGGENDGQKIFSIERPGEIAAFEEAIHIIIDKHPQRDSIIKMSFGGGAGGADDTPSASKLEKLKKDYDKAIASGNAMEANRLIRRIKEEENKNKK
jgi:hypothetical protein